tara:strand:- start:14831 stop:15019 length:189 start_codon:yes stop_codon:yes gene_type:complete
VGHEADTERTNAVTESSALADYFESREEIECVRLGKVIGNCGFHCGAPFEKVGQQQQQAVFS